VIEEVIPVQQEDEAIKNPVDTVHITNPPSNQTFKRLIKQLREARKEVARLKSEALSERIKMKELMDGYSHTLDLAIFAARRAQPLHRQLKNLYRKNKDFQSQNRNLKAELQQFQDEMAQRNLNVLVEAAIEKEKPVAKESIAPVKKHVTAKGKHVVVPKGSPPSTRRSVRLMK
jgi:predicted metalloendopeptidase